MTIQLTEEELNRYPQFVFGSKDLDLVHSSRKDWRNYYVENYQYVVDHGNGHKTLNTIRNGQRVPAMEDIEIVEHSVREYRPKGAAGQW